MANCKKPLRKFCKVVVVFFKKTETNFKQERRCTNNVTLRRVRVTIIAVGKLGIIYYECYKDRVSQTQLVNILFYLQGVDLNLHLVNEVIHPQVVFDSLCLSL